jgi:dUTPase
MKIGFGKVNKLAVIPKESSGIIPIVTPIPLEIQAGERVDLKTGLMVRVPEGYILHIQSSPGVLVDKGLEVLGPTFVAPEDEGELKIPLLNVGRGQLNLHPGMQVAVAIPRSLEPVEIETFSPEEPKVLPRQPRRPKGDPFKFEVS